MDPPKMNQTIEYQMCWTLYYLAVGLELRLAGVEAQPPPAQQIDDQKRGVQHPAYRRRVPDENVAHEVDLIVRILGNIVGNAPGQERPL